MYANKLKRAGYRLETIMLTRFAHNVLIIRAYSSERQPSKAQSPWCSHYSLTADMSRIRPYVYLRQSQDHQQKGLSGSLNNMQI